MRIYIYIYIYVCVCAFVYQKRVETLCSALQETQQACESTKKIKNGTLLFVCLLLFMTMDQC